MGTTNICIYKVDYLTTPIQLDVQYGESGKTSRAILDFLDKDTFRATGVDNDNAPRPTQFDAKDPNAETIIFRRKDCQQPLSPR